MRAATHETFLDSYLVEGRSVSLNLFFTIPLLILYEIGIQSTGSDLRNAAEVILKDLRWLMGPAGVRWFHWFLIALVGAFFLRAFSREQPFCRYFLVMLLESLLLAALLGPLLSIFVGTFLLEFPLTGAHEPTISMRLLLSIGAGVYEEFLFRFLLLGGLFWLVYRVFKAPRGFSIGLALIVSSLLFSLYHHLGPYGQPLSSYLFFFRFGAGLLLGVVFMARGFAVAVYLHVFYDIFRDIELLLDAQ